MGFKRKERKIIFECKTGSHLFGTNSPKSDEDYMGVFLPSTEDMLGLNEKCISVWDLSVKNSKGQRNSVGDVDRKFSSVQEHFRLALSGQSRETEAFFAPKEMIITTSPEWDKIIAAKDLFLSKKSIAGILSFARHQAIKSTLKGENLNMLRELLSLINKEALSEKVKPFLDKYKDEEIVKKIQIVKNEKNMEVMVFAGKQWDLTINLKRLKENLTKIEKTYGPRSEKTAEDGYDYKSLHHDYRLMFQAKEFLTTGNLTLPRPTEEANFLKKVKFGEYMSDYFQELEGLNKEIDDLLTKSSLPHEPDINKIKELCEEVLYQHLFE